MKIYYFARLNENCLKKIPNLAAEKMTLPEYYKKGSNVYGLQEGILLRWIELNYEALNPTKL